MKSYVIHLIRNMPCQGNLEGRYIGRTDSPLADASLGELLELKTKFRYPRATAFYASPSTRCVDTLRILYPEADPEVILEMAECDFGQWEGENRPRAAKRPPVPPVDGGGGQRRPAGRGERPGVPAAGVPRL